MNEVKLIGRIGKEPEIAKTNDGKAIVKFSVATTERWLDKINNEKKEKTEWHRVVIYNAKLCEILTAQKEELSGALVYISGKLRYEKWINQSGVEQKATSIVIDAFSGNCSVLSKKNKSNIENSDPMNNMQEKNMNNGLSEFELSDDSDEIPF